MILATSIISSSPRSCLLAFARLVLAARIDAVPMQYPGVPHLFDAARRQYWLFTLASSATHLLSALRHDYPAQSAPPQLPETAADATALSASGVLVKLTLPSQQAQAHAYEPYLTDDQLTTVVTSCDRNCGSRHMLVAHKKGDVIPFPPLRARSKSSPPISLRSPTGLKRSMATRFNWCAGGLRGVTRYSNARLSH